MKVIGTGFGRTGTDSMRHALNMLGFGPCHHMHEVMENEVQKTRWRELAAGKPPDWDLLFEGFQSCVDWPSAYYWRDLISVYPDAKVLLTWRSAETWWASFEKTILAGVSQTTDMESLGHALIFKQVFADRPHERDYAISVYEANVQAVKETVPANRLLVHSLGDGWEPLCAFLGVAIPEAPYPSGNDTAEFNTRMEAQPDVR